MPWHVESAWDLLHVFQAWLGVGTVREVDRSRPAWEVASSSGDRTSAAKQPKSSDFAPNTDQNGDRVRETQQSTPRNDANDDESDDELSETEGEVENVDAGYSSTGEETYSRP